MRLTYVTHVPGGLGGAEGLLVALLAGGASRDYPQTVLNFVSTHSSSQLPAACQGARYEEFSLGGPSNLLAARRWLDERVSLTRPEILHASLFLPLIAVASTRRVAGSVRLLTHVYGEGVTALSHPAVRKRMDRWACRRFDRIVAISDSVSHFLTEEQGLSVDHIQRIMPGWTGQPLPAVANGRPPTIVTVARLRPEKGHETLLSAFALLLDHLPEARLVLVGDGPMRNELEDSVRNRELVANVDFVGAVPDIWPYLAAADVFALASKSEAFGIAIVEAMAAGLPVVAPAVGGIPELVMPGVNGELFPPGNVDAFAARLLGMLTCERRAEMASAARQTADAHRMERTVDQYFELYDQLVELSRNRGVST